MLTAKPTPPLTDDPGDGAQEPEFKPLTREEARQWRASQPGLSLWRLVGVQWLVGLLAAAVAALLTQRASVAVSVLYGAATVAIPSALMAYGLTSSALSRLASGFAQAALVGFLFWEGVKILLSVAMLAAAGMQVLAAWLEWGGIAASPAGPAWAVVHGTLQPTDDPQGWTHEAHAADLKRALGPACNELMTVLRASRDNEVKITIKGFQHLMHTKCCL